MDVSRAISWDAGTDVPVWFQGSGLGAPCIEIALTNMAQGVW